MICMGVGGRKKACVYSDAGRKKASERRRLYILSTDSYTYEYRFFIQTNIQTPLSHSVSYCLQDSYDKQRRLIIQYIILYYIILYCLQESYETPVDNIYRSPKASDNTIMYYIILYYIVYRSPITIQYNIIYTIHKTGKNEKKFKFSVQYI